MGSNPANLVGVDGVLYFTATDPINGTTSRLTEGPPRSLRWGGSCFPSP